jgi:hypothetical protein
MCNIVSPRIAHGSLPQPDFWNQALDDFFRWCGDELVEGFTKATVNAYRANLEARHLSSSTINQRLSAIRKLARNSSRNPRRAMRCADSG